MRTNKPFRTVEKSKDLFEIFSLKSLSKIEVNQESKKFFDYLNNLEHFSKTETIQVYAKEGLIDTPELDGFVDFLRNNGFIIGE